MNFRPHVQIALDWAIRCFGEDHVYNPRARALRLAEEAVELAQALDVGRDVMHLLIDAVYNRPPGKMDQELGGVAMTFTVLAASFDNDPDEYLMAELRRVLAKPSEHFAARNEEKNKLGLV